MISWRVGRSKEEAFGFVNMRSTITVKAQGGVDELANMGSRYYQAVRQYRVRLLNGTGVEPLFPIWTTAEEMPDLARHMLDAGLRAVLTCVDPKQLDKRFVGREFDDDLMADLPPGVDPCGERGEFHTFCYRCPEFRSDILVTVGDVVEREGFWFAELLPAETTCVE
jgi:diphthamide synthase (EF-2-diphthine--ammonia ligase)